MNLTYLQDSENRYLTREQRKYQQIKLGQLGAYYEVV